MMGRAQEHVHLICLSPGNPQTCADNVTPKKKPVAHVPAVEQALK